MISQQPHTPGAEPGEKDLFSQDEVRSTGFDLHLDTHQPTFGSRLRAAREARGLEIETCAQALRLPARVLRKLENDQRDDLDTQVYLGSYITKYGRHLGIDEDAIGAEVARLRTQEAPTLVATGGISHSRYLLERYATAATYLVLTAVIVVPMVWLGISGTLNRDISHLAPLDAAPVAQQDLPHSSTPVPDTADLVPPKVQAQRSAADDQPLLASMVPDMSAEAPKVDASDAAVMAGSGAHAVGLILGEASWVDVTAADGSRLEYGLLPAGTHKSYRSDQPLEVRLGNARGASVMLDGQSMSLDAYRRANVAHFKVAIENGKAVPQGF